MLKADIGRTIRICGFAACGAKAQISEAARSVIRRFGPAAARSWRFAEISARAIRSEKSRARVAMKRRKRPIAPARGSFDISRKTAEGKLALESIAVDYAHRAAPRADPLGSNPPHGLDS